ncbi:MAG: type II toxin-antitoxin system VapC family toxin [Propionibacteriaceae bacterium]|nr:type II toxin-antitoxin system VapC family toxin [Propionibacteriaceae bacterium]
MITAFDADVIIYAGAQEHPLGLQAARLIDHPADGDSAIGCVLLLTEVLTKPTRADAMSAETQRLQQLLSRIDLRPLDAHTCVLALALAVKYGLKSADAAHLATAVIANADRFLTNNRKDFRHSIEEIEIVYPDEL